MDVKQSASGECWPGSERRPGTWTPRHSRGQHRQHERVGLWGASQPQPPAHLLTHGRAVTDDAYNSWTVNIQYFVKTRHSR